MFKKINFGLFVFILFFVMTAIVMAVTVTHSETGLKFNIPGDWSYDQEDNHFVAVSPDEDVILFFFVGKTDNIDDFFENIAEELSNVLEDPEISEEPYEEEVNGLIQVRMEGSGDYDGDIVDWDMTMVFGGNKSMSVIALGNISEMQDDIDQIYSSITSSHSAQTDSESTDSGFLHDVLSANKWNMLYGGQSYGTLLLKENGTAVKTGEGGIMETTGSWALENNQFTLHFPDEGDPITGSLTQNGDNLTVDFMGIVWTYEPIK